MKRTRFVRGAWLCALLALAIAPACRAADVLNVGLIPAEDPRTMSTEYKPLTDYLGGALGMEVRPFVATDYNGVIEALRSKRLDVAMLGPFSYVLATTVADIEAFAVPETSKAGISYHAVIIARKDRGYRTLADLKGRSFAFVDPSSTSGHLFPKAALVKMGQDPDAFFGRVLFSGGHDASAIAVQNGKVDAAAVADMLLEAAYTRGVVNRDEIQVLWTSNPIPTVPYVMRRDLPEDLRKRIRAAFLAIHDLPLGSHATIVRVDPTTDAAYDGVRETAKVLNLDLKKLK
ncbi:MAG TPA: phosphate/phosphite/phosphonate ABC transporter substrate-binding protein [Burkholderiales bacterium]|nr:phosphate/phosphite/phosphonate ABC transporter substrate-binding protein [Burkholderiales bacterium]